MGHSAPSRENRSEEVNGSHAIHSYGNGLHFFDLATVEQIFLRSPAGVETQVTRLASGATLVAQGPDGSLLFTTFEAGLHYYPGPGGQAEVVSAGWRPTVERVPLFIDGRPHMVLGRSLFRLR